MISCFQFDNNFVKRKGNFAMLFKRFILICILPLTLGDLEGNKNEDTSRQGRLFSLFSVVTFPNTGCTLKSTANDATPLEGLCRTSSECTTAGGTSDGSCAAGFGVCCKYKVSNCSSTIDKNITYIESPTIPNTVALTCVYNIQPVQSDICQIRLDFVTFVITVSAAPPFGACGGTEDLFQITGNTGAKYSPICGTNTGQHVYIQNTGTSSNTILTYTTGTASATITRKWNIKVTQIECSNPSKAPGDCFQYFTGASGNIKSFNFIEGLTGGTMLQNQLYTACVRQEQGFCKIEYSTLDTPDNFKLGDGTTALQDDLCMTSFASVIIPTSDSIYSLFCGAYLSSVTLDTQSGVVRETVAPFTLGVASSNTDQTTGTGFNIAYNQVPCS